MESFATANFINLIHNNAEDVTGTEDFRDRVSSDHIYPYIHFAILASIAEFGKKSTIFIVEGTNREDFVEQHRLIDQVHIPLRSLFITLIGFQIDSARYYNLY